MAIMAPEAAAGAASAAGIGAAGKASDQLEGSTVAFMLAIVLIGGAFAAFWLAFHNPSEWDLTGGQWPGLAGRALQWMQTKAEGPSLLGTLNTSQPAATGAGGVAGAIEQGATRTTEGQIPGIGPVIVLAPLLNALKKWLHL